MCIRDSFPGVLLQPLGHLSGGAFGAASGRPSGPPILAPGPGADKEALMAVRAGWPAWQNDGMSYLVLARKWRPRRFAELVGQEHVVRALSLSLIHI